jgi:PTS hybrid protein
MADRTITSSVALHARPASLLARAVAELDAVVTLRHGEREANAKGALSLLALDVEAGDAVVVAARGPDERAALQVVVQHLTAGDA